MNRCPVCVAAGIALCLHLVALEAREATHPNRPEAKPAVVAVARPPRPDDHHREFSATVRIVSVNYAVTTSGTSITPGSGSLRFGVPLVTSSQEAWR